MDGQELQELAVKVSAIIEGNSISRIIGHDVAEWLRESTFDRGMQYRFVMPLAGGNALQFNIHVTLAGEIDIELLDNYGSPFWKGVLKEFK